MKKIILLIAFTATFSYCFYHLTIAVLPNVIYGVLHFKANQNHPDSDNQLTYHALPNDQSRAVVMPNPDFLYVSSFYDLTEGPLRITGTLPDSTYWSLAFYQPNTLNWYIKNDLQFGTNQLDLLLATEDQDRTGLEASEVALSPVRKGFLLFRILVTDPARLPEFEARQKSIRLTPALKN
ncbi:MAG: DUF1254 domain-containing protein [Bacteroidetes bacterium]|nr:MAG: DUF1254 domain-containing protein [Bacteroidota bacterium]